jgi:hypothetical protein
VRAESQRFPGGAALVCALTCACSVMAPLHAEYAPNLRMDSRVERALIRLIARQDYALPSPLMVWPYNALVVRQLLSGLDSLEQAGALTPHEYYDLTLLRRIATGDRALYSWRADSASLEGHLHLQLIGQTDPAWDFEHDSDSLFASGMFGAGLSASLRKLSLYGGVEVATHYCSEPFPGSSFQPYDGVSYTLYGRADSSNLRATDMVRGGIVYETNRLVLDGGLDYLKVGPSVYSPLLLSGQAPPVTYARAGLDLKLVQYTHLVGLLRSQKDKTKYLYLQRIDVPIRSWHLHAAITQMVVTGATTDQVVDPSRPVYYPSMDREFEWLYLVPFVPFSFTEHYLGDRDNSVLSFDVTFMWPRGFRWYAEMLFDDITAPWTIFSEDWGNKWAIAAGGQWFGVLAGRDVSLSAEYARVEPWVYTHFYGGSHNLTHYGQGLGAPLGPNSESIRVAADMALGRRHTAGLTFANDRKGVTRGSTITDVFQDTTEYYVPQYADSWTKEFLGPGMHRSTRIGAFYAYSPLGRFRIETGFEFDLNERKRFIGRFAGGWSW